LKDRIEKKKWRLDDCDGSNEKRIGRRNEERGVKKSNEKSRREEKEMKSGVKE
jgi:hypothetical protein